MRSKSRSALLLVLTYSKRNWKMMMMMMMTHQKSKPPNLPSFLPSKLPTAKLLQKAHNFAKKERKQS